MADSCAAHSAVYTQHNCLDQQRPGSHSTPPPLTPCGQAVDPLSDTQSKDWHTLLQPGCLSS